MTVVVRCAAPAVPVTVTVAVVEPVVLVVDEDPPQAVRLINPIAQAMIARPVKYLRRRRKNARRAQATTRPPPAGHRNHALCDAAIVIVVLAVAVVGVTVAGAKVQVVPAGKNPTSPGPKRR